jgi:hypothetical protein
MADLHAFARVFTICITAWYYITMVDTIKKRLIGLSVIGGIAILSCFYTSAMISPLIIPQLQPLGDLVFDACLSGVMFCQVKHWSLCGRFTLWFYAVFVTICGYDDATKLGGFLVGVYLLYTIFNRFYPPVKKVS